MFRNIDSRPEMESKLIELAEAGQLSITALLRLPQRQRELAGQVVLGLAMHPVQSELGEHRNPVPHGRPLPPALERYRVVVEGRGATLDPDDRRQGVLTWVVGTRGSAERAANRGASYGLSGRHSEVRVVDDVRAAQLTDNRATLGVADAWHLLKQHGEGLSYGGSPEAERQRWRCREVLPSTASPSKRKVA